MAGTSRRRGLVEAYVLYDCQMGASPHTCQICVQSPGYLLCGVLHPTLYCCLEFLGLSLTGVASDIINQELGLTTPVIGTGAHVNNKRPTINKLQFLVLLTRFHSFRLAFLFLPSSFYARWLFRQSAKHAGFTGLLRRLRATWTVHDTEFWLCEVRKWQSRAKWRQFRPKKLGARDARRVNRMLTLQTFLG